MNKEAKWYKVIFTDGSEQDVLSYRATWAGEYALKAYPRKKIKNIITLDRAVQ